MQNAKIAAYLGFCIRAGKATFGVDSLEEKKKGVFLIVADGALSESSMKNAVRLKDKFSCPLVVTEKGVLGTFISRPAVKVMGVGEKHLAEAIVKEAENIEELKLYSGGTN